MLAPSEYAKLLTLLQELDGKADAPSYLRIVEFLEGQGTLNLTLALYLSRACINLYNLTGEERYLIRAQDVLDTFAQDGRDDPFYLFVKGYALYLEDLCDDAIIRLQRAKRLVPLNRPELLEKIDNLLRVCQARVQERQLDPSEYRRLSDHCRRFFGDGEFLESRGAVSLMAYPSFKDFTLIISKGLMEQEMPGGDEGRPWRAELVLALRKEWPLDDRDKKYRWPFDLMYDLCDFARFNRGSLGFGFTYDKGSKLHELSSFSGAMLASVGGFEEEAQSFVLSDGSAVRFLEIIPLCPMEIAYRRRHSAFDLLQILKERKVPLSPVTEGRADALASLKVGSGQ